MSTALVILVLTYLLISVRVLPRVRVGRATAALVGAFLMVFTGVMGLTEAWMSIDIDVLLLLLGMMLLVSSLQSCGLFDIICAWMVRTSSTPIVFFILVCIVTAVLSALVLNDAVVLLLTPVIIESCYRLGIKPFPYLIGHVMSANIGSLATVVGNPQNAFIATKAGIGFIDFSMRLLPVATISLLMMMVMLVAIFRKDILETNFDRTLDSARMVTIEGLKERDACTRRCIIGRVGNLRLLLVITLVTVVAFTWSQSLGLPLAHIAFISGTTAALLTTLLTDVRASEINDGINWSIILFFVGLFVVIGGAASSGLLSDFETSLVAISGQDADSPMVLFLSAAFLSNLVSNVPAVLLIAEMLPMSEDAWYSLAAASTLAGNATLIASAVNIIMAERAEKLGVEIDFLRFMAVGLPVSIVTLTLAFLLMT